MSCYAVPKHPILLRSAPEEFSQPGADMSIQANRGPSLIKLEQLLLTQQCLSLVVHIESVAAISLFWSLNVRHIGVQRYVTSNRFHNIVLAESVGIGL